MSLTLRFLYTSEKTYCNNFFEQYLLLLIIKFIKMRRWTFLLVLGLVFLINVNPAFSKPKPQEDGEAVEVSTLLEFLCENIKFASFTLVMFSRRKKL